MNINMHMHLLVKKFPGPAARHEYYYRSSLRVLLGGCTGSLHQRFSMCRYSQDCLVSDYCRYKIIVTNCYVFMLVVYTQGSFLRLSASQVIGRPPPPPLARVKPHSPPPLRTISSGRNSHTSSSDSNNNTSYLLFLL